ncbi:hypothetical protein OCI51_26405 (plasmid) [Lysinibacillus capsici]|uniref:hypothetical protein n=1 Tax=Lysinibacillus capsici TaxID=2115968 RepID=UPI0021DA36F5|nr:hypothetical protein [Lysinibacillus capsici]UYB50143.1 hypothetical protein OCI51_26795 [Lysinibacillus capsici]UYB50217.1 hypothetical protein OCI51_26405 [Lysinibacillus capsici]
MVKRVPVTFSEHEEDLYKYLESKSIPNATYIKQLIRKDMQGTFGSVVDEDAIEKAVEKVLSKKGLDATVIDKKDAEVQGKLTGDGGMEF